MNGVGDRCKAVLLLVQDSALLQDAGAERTRGYHCACAVPAAAAGPVESDLASYVREQTKQFCATNKLRVSFMEREYTEGEILSSSDGLAKVTSPLTVMECSAAGLEAVRAKLLASAPPGEEANVKNSPYCLLAVLDLTRHRVVNVRLDTEERPAAAAAPTALSWLRPRQSYVSECLRERRGRGNSAEAALCLFPLHMYCAFPILRDTGFDATPEVLLVGDNVSTLDGVLRELGYKAGQLPKYGA